MIWFLYNVLFTLGFVIVLPHFLLRMRRRGGYARHFGQRLGRYEPDTLQHLARKPRVWVHAVSVGETFVALRLIQELKAHHPPYGFVLTVNTSTAYIIAEEALSSEDVLLYFPADFPWIIRRVLKIIKPLGLLLMECELWPNLIRLARAGGIPVAVVNGRISDHSYQGYRKVRLFTRRLLPQINLFCVQTTVDRDRLADLGARPDRIRVMGSAKYDVGVQDVDGGDAARSVLWAAGITGEHVVVLGGSTWPGEESALLDIVSDLRAQQNSIALVLAPRHVERSPEVIEDIQARGFKFVRRTSLDPTGAPNGMEFPGVLLLDTTGELRNFYGCADVIFVGKSLTQHGGQNIIEPAVFGKPIIVGPHMENFPVVIDDFLQAEALKQVRNELELKQALRELLSNPARRAYYGERAARLVREKRGALKASATLISDLLAAETRNLTPET